MSLNLPQIRFGNVSQNQIGNSRPNHRLFVFLQETDTLHRGIRPLIELPRQIFHRKNPGMLRNRNFLMIQIIHRRLRKYGTTGFLKDFLREILHIVADKYPHPVRMNPKKAPDLLIQLSGLYCKRRLFFHIDTFYASHTSSISCLLLSAGNHSPLAVLPQSGCFLPYHPGRPFPSSTPSIFNMNRISLSTVSAVIPMV